MTLQDARNKLSELQWKAKRRINSEPTMLRVSFHNDSQVVKNAAIWAEREKLWSWPSNFNPAYPSAEDKPFKSFNLGQSENDFWRHKVNEI